ncbi:penicillin-binding protein 1A [Alkalithermobacter thermoalcaliphilus JW-YL-7 = DSM 7308]|uniref:Penicillin-binding protein 1A n=1 Tax=Alkalithermobacter thermoalcaliphilus JW-YL-7 = DSM 7308 TaxID=1121328 RepID=A0A150FP30_CLOPD|nr:glycosyl transferase family 51 [[Clostridium] paradoxum JW-YL-7 = DSM 7308]SHK53428.1 penicillin-binding protein 1A [[Clostridium] paradoxum JW-YL-7 = DSM 7308]
MNNGNNKNGKNKSNEDNQKKKLSILRLLIIVFFIISLSTVAAGLGIVGGVIKTTKPIDPNSLHSMLDTSSFIFDKDGNLVETIHGSDYRDIVTLDRIPKHLQNAFIAIEDERFYKHRGIDIRRIFGAAIHNLRTGSKHGASTITQQLAKNVYLTNEKTYTRKIRDAYYAIQLERALTKDQILEAYLNIAGLGRGAVGVQAAAHTYFSKDVSELNLAESALIAGITRFPSRYSAYITERFDGSENFKEVQFVMYPKTPNTEPATDKEKEAFKKLLSHGRITPAQYNELVKENWVIRKAVFNPVSKSRQEVVLRKMLELGYINEQEYKEAKDYEIKIKVGTRRNETISSYFADMVKDEVIDTLIKAGYTEDEARDTLLRGGLRIYSTMDMNIQKILEEEYENDKNFPGSFRDADGIIQPQSAMVIMDHSTGEVRGIVGGRKITGSRVYNRAINPRQPGSAIKPISVYLPALDIGYTPGTVIDEVPIFNEKGEMWPKNYNNRYKGLTTLRELLKDSANVGTVRLAQVLSTSESNSVNLIIDYLEKLRISTIDKRNDSNFAALTLGGMTKGISPLELTAAYGAIANQGTYIKPIFFTRVETASGEVLLENKPVKHTVTTPQVAYLLTDMLTDVVNRGTGRGARLSNMPVAGKTGTTTNNYDAWFVGYTPYYVGATWIGSDKNTRLSQGSPMAARLWNKVMSRVHSNLERKSFNRPSDIVEVTICTVSGKLPSDICSHDERGTIQKELFVRGTEPTTICDTHVAVQVDKENNLLITENTPEENIITRVFIRRLVPVTRPPYPDDYKYQVPTKYSDNKRKSLIDEIIDRWLPDNNQDESSDEEVTDSIETKPNEKEKNKDKKENDKKNEEKQESNVIVN